MSGRRKGESGASLMEYVILLSFVAMAVIPVVKYFGLRGACRECVNACAISPPPENVDTWLNPAHRQSVIDGCASGSYSVEALCGSCSTG